MPGQVLRILTSPGSDVHRGDPLVVLEAMKMEQTIYAHADGVVEQVLVTAGQVVAPGQLLVRIHSKEEA
jgi:biotin carboxyl carrier protein